MSRYSKFLICKRKYFYDYYLKFDEEIAQKKIKFLKNLTSKPLEIGNIVHDIIKNILRRYKININPINKDKFLKYSFEITKKSCKNKFFFEHYYNGEVILIHEIYEKISYILENFLNSPSFAWIKEVAISNSNKWIIEPINCKSKIDDYTIFCKVDFLFPISDKIYIIDWKTGKPDKKHNKQLTGYALWANCYFNNKAANIIPIVVYLYPKYNAKSIIFDEFSVVEFKKTIEIETNNMYKYLINIEKNIPKSKKEFQLTNNRFFCKFCNYKEIC
ncbi:MAG: PD-(D/E)XK nuclease family protein [Endomicrobium sp.]|jgi:hypothetical protein|nr:PD-(D/E)XK nuclease family protein [Endomicrobium sp.]